MGLQKNLLEKKFGMFLPFQKTWFHPFIHSSIHPSIHPLGDPNLMVRGTLKYGKANKRVSIMLLGTLLFLYTWIDR
jgi:hypothetical protein